MNTSPKHYALLSLLVLACLSGRFLSARGLPRIDGIGHGSIQTDHSSSVRRLNPGWEAEETSGVASDTWQNRVENPEFMIHWTAPDHLTPTGYYLYWGSDLNGTSNDWIEDPFFRPGDVEPGSYYLRVAEKGIDGRPFNWQTIFIFLYDPNPPSQMTEVGEKHGAPGSICQSVTNHPEFYWLGATDDASGIDYYEYYFGQDTTPSLRTGWTREQSVRVGPVAPGIYYFSLRTIDRAGNISDWQRYFNFHYDRCTVPGTPPMAGWCIGGFFTVVVIAFLPNFLKIRKERG